MLRKQLQKVASFSQLLRKLGSVPSIPAKPGVVGKVADHLKNQVGKHGILPVAGSIAGGAALMSSAAKAPSKYNQFKQGFRPENHQVGAKVGE